MLGPRFLPESIFYTQSVVRGPWSVVRGPWSVVRGPRSAVRSPQSVVRSPCFILTALLSTRQLATDGNCVRQIVSKFFLHSKTQKCEDFQDDFWHENILTPE